MIVVNSASVFYIGDTLPNTLPKYSLNFTNVAII